ncbi:hypothetical protein B0H13DRAFT_2482117 [Mycena leptocephala]|nr:hypothetical protein B0H13DRAFT_2482117 [Mycena leptocephala]
MLPTPPRNVYSLAFSGLLAASDLTSAALSQALTPSLPSVPRPPTCLPTNGALTPQSSTRRKESSLQCGTSPSMPSSPPAWINFPALIPVTRSRCIVRYGPDSGPRHPSFLRLASDSSASAPGVPSDQRRVFSDFRIILVCRYVPCSRYTHLPILIIPNSRPHGD